MESKVLQEARRDGVQGPQHEIINHNTNLGWEFQEVLELRGGRQARAVISFFLHLCADVWGRLSWPVSDC